MRCVKLIFSICLIVVVASQAHIFDGQPREDQQQVDKTYNLLAIHDYDHHHHDHNQSDNLPTITLLWRIVEGSIRRFKSAKIQRRINPLLLPLRILAALLRILLLPLRILLAPLIVLLRALLQILRMLLRLLVELIFGGPIFLANVARILLMIVAEILRIILRIRRRELEEKDEHRERHVITIVEEDTTTTTTMRPIYFVAPKKKHKKNRHQSNSRRNDHLKANKNDKLEQLQKLDKQLDKERIMMQQLVKLINLSQTCENFNYQQSYLVDGVYNEPVCGLTSTTTVGQAVLSRYSRSSN